MKFSTLFVTAVLVMSCSDDTRSDSDDPDLRSIQASCNQEVAGLCGQTPGREQIECIQRELRRCLEGAAATEPGSEAP